MPKIPKYHNKRMRFFNIKAQKFITDAFEIGIICSWLLNQI